MMLPLTRLDRVKTFKHSSPWPQASNSSISALRSSNILLEIHIHIAFLAIRGRWTLILPGTDVLPVLWVCAGRSQSFSEICGQIRVHQALFLALTQSGMHRWTCFLLILAASAVRAISDQRVFQQHAGPGSDLKPTQRASGMVNSTGNLIFWSVNSLLQHWPNTRYVNGTAMFRCAPVPVR